MSVARARDHDRAEVVDDGGVDEGTKKDVLAIEWSLKGDTIRV